MIYIISITLAPLLSACHIVVNNDGFKEQNLNIADLNELKNQL
jgi:hypothetical protein